MEEKETVQPVQRKKGNFLQILVVVFIVLIPVAVYIIQRSAEKKPASNNFTTASQLSSAKMYDPTCEGQKQKYAALLETESVVDGITVGSLKGIIKQAIYDPVAKSEKLILRAEDNDTPYEISIKDGTVRIANTVKHSYETSLNVLSANQHVELSYNCDPQNKNLFTIVSVSINQ